MACACKVSQQLSKIQKEYDIPSNENNKKININVKKILISVIILLLSPLMLFFILNKLIFSRDKGIDIRKIFLKKTYGKK